MKHKNFTVGVFWGGLSWGFLSGVFCWGYMSGVFCWGYMSGGVCPRIAALLSYLFTNWLAYLYGRMQSPRPDVMPDRREGITRDAGFGFACIDTQAS